MRRTIKKKAFLVHVEMPKGCSVEAMRCYILDAVQTWRGQLRPAGAYGENDPGDPLFDLNYETVTVARSPKHDTADEIVDLPLRAAAPATGGA